MTFPALSREELDRISRRVHRAFWDARKEAERDLARRGVRRASPVFIPFRVEGETWQEAVRSVLPQEVDPDTDPGFGRRLFRFFRDPGQLRKPTEPDGWSNLYEPARVGYEAAGSALSELKEELTGNQRSVQQGEAS